MNRYSAIAIFDKDLDRVVLIEKQKPAWQAGKANFPGGKVETVDYATDSSLFVDESKIDEDLDTYSMIAPWLTQPLTHTSPAPSAKPPKRLA